MRTIEDRLIGNGLIFREARLKSQSVSNIDRKIILRVRNEAYGSGLDRRAVNALEMRGERGEFGLRAVPYESVFKGLQTILGPFTMRLYDIQGDHELNGSTVSLMTLVHKRIPIYDISFPRVVLEYLKEVILISWIEVLLWLKR